MFNVSYFLSLNVAEKQDRRMLLFRERDVISSMRAAEQDGTNRERERCATASSGN